MKPKNKDTRYYIDLDLKNMRIIKWDLPKHFLIPFIKGYLLPKVNIIRLQEKDLNLTNELFI